MHRHILRSVSTSSRCPQWIAFGLLAFTTALTGCESDSFMNPSVVGRWEHTPVTLPILQRLDVIEPTDDSRLAVTSVQASDLIPDMREYVIGPGDLVTVVVFELISPGQESVNTRRVDETGQLRLPVIGSIRTAGFSASQLEIEIKNILERKSILRDAQVSVIMQESRQNTFSVIGQPLQGGTAIGTYMIPKPDFRMLDALVLARGVPGRTKKLHIFRQTPLSSEVAGDLASDTTNDGQLEPAPPATTDPTQLIEELIEGIDTEPEANTPSPKVPAPPAIESGLDHDPQPGQWVYVGNRWVKIDAHGPGAAAPEQIAGDTGLSSLITQRIIEIPYERLLNGDMRYNIIIRAGDVIRVPDSSAGYVYIMGQINRPGAYTVPGEASLTLKQLVASAGNLSQIAIPERVDLIRRVGDNEESMIRLNVRAIFEGTEPDIFLKPDDLLNVGTDFIATPLAIFRNGLRMTYGFGFVLDRNWGPEVFP